MVAQVQFELTGFSGSPGINTWYVSDGWVGAGDEPEQAGFILADFAAFYSDRAAVYQQDVTIRALGEVRIKDEATGQTTQVVAPDSVPDPVEGTSTGPASHATMIKTRMRTGVFADGREIRGGPFLGPVTSTVILDNGDISPSTAESIRTALQTLANALPIHGANLGVYRRPREATAPGGARAGQFAEAQNFGIFPRPAVLRSRRD